MEPSKNSGDRLGAVVAAASSLALVVAYTALCLVVLYRPGLLPSRSTLHAALVGPPHWLIWGAEARPMFWAATLAVAAVAVVGVRFLLACPHLCCPLLSHLARLRISVGGHVCLGEQA